MVTKKYIHTHCTNDFVIYSIAQTPVLSDLLIPRTLDTMFSHFSMLP